jgi:hypothetical protein
LIALTVDHRTNAFLGRTMLFARKASCAPLAAG